MRAPPGTDAAMLDHVRSEVLGGHYDLHAMAAAGAVVLDCGAHIGMFSRWALAKGIARVISFEPSPATRLSLEHNLAREIASGQCTIVPLAVSDTTGVSSFSTADLGNPGSHHLVAQAADGDHTVGVDTIDNVVKSLALNRVDFIKMDIEGAEVAALRGAIDTIRRFQPILAIATEHTADPLANARAVIEAMRQIDERYDWIATCVRPQRRADGRRVLVPMVIQFHRR
jgi:FkbM family methyltransferase